MKRAVLVIALALVSVVGNAQQDDEKQKLKNAERDFKTALKSGDASALETAIKQLVAVNNKDAVKVITSTFGRLGDGDTAIYWLLVKGMASFTSKDALEQVADYIFAGTTKAWTTRDILIMLQNNHTEEVLSVFVKAMEEGTDEQKLVALDGITTVSANPALSKKAIPILINALKRAGDKDSEMKRRVVKALTAITKQEYGDSVSNWEGWWQKNKDGDLKSVEGDKVRSTGTVVDNLDPTRNSEFEKLEKIDKEKVVVVNTVCKGKNNEDHSFDHIENILKRMGIPHITMIKEEFEDDKFKTDGVMAVIINCGYFRRHCIAPTHHAGTDPVSPRAMICVSPDGSPHQDVEHPFTAKGIQKIGTFVERGGYLFTEDWELEDVLERAFPQYVGHTEYLDNKVVKVLPQVGSTSHPYLRNIFVERQVPKLPDADKKAPDDGQKPADGETQTDKEKPKDDKTSSEGGVDFKKLEHTWKIDKDSPSIKVISQLVTVLMVSPDLKEQAVAITFSIGGSGKPDDPKRGYQQDRSKMSGGRVLHVLSHFGKQKEQSDEFTLQNLILNFLIEANERRLMKEKKK